MGKPKTMKWVFYISLPGIRIKSPSGANVGLNSARREIVFSVTFVFYDKVRGRNKAQR
jgi:hypothetical protein